MDKVNKVFLSAEKSRLVKERIEVEYKLTKLELWSSRISSETNNFKENEDAALEIIRRRNIKSRLKRIKEAAFSMRERFCTHIKNLLVDSSSAANDNATIYPSLQEWERNYMFEYIGNDDMFIQVIEKIKHEYLIEAVLLLRKQLKSLDERIRHIIRNLTALMLDKRAYYRSIVKLLFKNMDDEHSAVNNTAENNQMSYLQLKVRYGTGTYQKIKAGTRRFAIAG